MVMISLGGLVVAAPSASAATFEYNLAYDPFFDPISSAKCLNDGTDYACYHEYGDYLEVSDFSADGRSSGMQWKTDDGRAGLCRNKLGSRSIGFCNKDFAEGHKFSFRFGACDGDVSNCTVAGSGWNWKSGWGTATT